METKKPLVIIAGPTAVGKTSSSVELAKRINGSIISADSMQIYKYMDIGSAKIKPEEMQGIPHYLVDELYPEDEFHVVRFVEMAKAALHKIYDAGKIPIIVGGTGFYIQALLYDIDFKEEKTDSTYRKELEDLAKKEGPDYLFSMLQQVDPESCEVIHHNNTKRVIRALEFFHDNGFKISEHNKLQQEKESPYKYCFFVLTDERTLLYKRIDERVDNMLEEGLVEEVEFLHKKGYTKDMVSMQGLGYKEILDFLNNETSLDNAIYRIKRDTRHFAKRQITWFKREKNVIWINRSDHHQDTQCIVDYMIKKLKEKKLVN